MKMKGRDYQHSEKLQLLAGKEKLIDLKTIFEGTASNIYFFNTGEAELEVYLEGQEGFKFVPAGTIASFEDKNLTKALIKNTTSLTASLVVNADNETKELHCLKELSGLK
jgi:hypothetical protein